VIVQSDDLMLSTLLVAPTSRSASPRSFRPTILINDQETQVLVEQTSAVAPERLGDFVGRVSHNELAEINDALRRTLELD
jgi:mRNA interferase MazF